jgi:hypothetical protein
MSVAPPAVPSKSSSSAEPRAIPSLLLVVAVATIGGITTGVMLGAVLGKLVPLLPAVIAGVVVAIAVPSLLAWRASKFLRARRIGVGIRRFVQLVLLAIPMITLGLLCAPALGEGDATVGGEWARGAHSLFGGIPVVGGVLADTAQRGGAPVGPVLPTTPPVKPVADAGIKPTGPDGGPTVVDAGVAPVPVPVPVSVAGLSPRTAGRPLRTVLVPVQTDDGGLAWWTATMAFGGAHTQRIIDCTPQAALGAPTQWGIADDGHAIMVLGGGHVVTATASATLCTLEPTLSRGAKLAAGGTELEITGVRTAAVAPGGGLLLTVDAIDVKRAKPVQALLWRSADAVVTVIKRSGDVLVDGSTPAPKAKRVLSVGFTIKSQDGGGGVVIDEEFAEEGQQTAVRMSGLAYDMNPHRLLSGTIDQVKALVEVARTGMSGSGLNGCSLQGFADATRHPDGRVWFDGNCLEAGAKGWLFSARAGGGVFALAPELQGKDQAPWTEQAPRLQRLTIEPEGAFAFITRDANVVLSSTQKVATKITVVLRAEAIDAGVKVGVVSSVHTPELLTGGEWLLAGVELLAEGGKRPRAWLLGSRADLDAQKLSVLVREGAVLAVPTVAAVVGEAATPTPKTIKRIYFSDRDEPLWHAATTTAPVTP